MNTRMRGMVLLALAFGLGIGLGLSLNLAPAAHARADTATAGPRQGATHTAAAWDKRTGADSDRRFR